jgi:hypothetical protein
MAANPDREDISSAIYCAERRRGCPSFKSSPVNFHSGIFSPMVAVKHRDQNDRANRPW